MPPSLSVLAAVLLLLAAGPGDPTIYAWTDAEGVAHYTSDASTIPQRYRDRARTLDGRPVSSAEGAETPPPAEPKPGASEEAPKQAAVKPPAARVEESEEESAPPPLAPGAAETLDEAAWRKRFQRGNERLRRAELTLARDREQLSRVANEESTMVVDAYGHPVTTTRSTALRMQVADDERVLHDARESLQDLERAAAREAIPFEWRR
jgi:hypothetical protein